MSEVESISPAKPRRRRRLLLWNTAGVAVALALVVTALVIWVNSGQFQNMVRERLTSQMQTATGGRVEIASFEWHLMELEATASGVVIHGDEQPTDAPYARVESLRVRFSVLGVLSPRVQLRALIVRRPQIHLIFYPDGKTNQPHPAQEHKTKRSGMDTFFDLRAGHVAVEQGVIDLDDRVGRLDVQNRYQPLDFQASDASVVLQYVAAAGGKPEKYHMEAGVRDLDLGRGGTMQNVATVHGYLQASLDLLRDGAILRSLRLTSAARGSEDRTLDVSGTLTHFSEPHWQATVRGELDLRLLDPVLGYPLVPEGISKLDLICAGDGGAFRVDGTMRVEKGSFAAPGIAVRGADVAAHVHADANALRVTQVVGRLQQGGEMQGEVLLDHWLPVETRPVMEAGVPAASTHTELRKKSGTHLHSTPSPQPKPVAPPHSVLVKNPHLEIFVNGIVHANFKNVPLDTVLDVVGQRPFERLGFDTLLSGPATAVWTHGDVNTLTVKGAFGLRPPAQVAAGETPASGAIEATYTQKDGSVDLRTFQVNLPASRMSAHGRIGAFPLTSPTALMVDIESTNLGEFDTVLRDLGLTREGKSGAAALPVALGGAAEFHGSWANSLLSPRLAGNLKASQISVELPPAPSAPGKPQTIKWDSIEADGSYDAEHIAIVQAQLRRGEALIALDGTLVAAPAGAGAGAGRRRPTMVRGDEMPAFDRDALVHGHVRATKVSVADLLPFTGQSLPVTGSLDAQISVEGPASAPGGSGWVQLNDGVVYGEPVTTLHAQGSVESRTVKIASFVVTGKAGGIGGSGSYDVDTGRFQVEARGGGIDIAKIERLRSTGESLSGTLGFDVSASGTRDEPRVEGHALVSDFAVEGEPLGTVTVTAHTEGDKLHFDGTTRVESAEVAVHGQTELRGDFATQAKAEFSQFDVGTVFKLAHLEGVSAQSALSGTASVEGPLARPSEMRGEVRLAEMQVTVEGVHLKSEGGILASLAGDTVTLDPVHITGEDTDLRAQGTLGLKDTRKLDFAASGSVNLKLMETLDRDVTAGGTSTFQLEAHGPLSNPGLRGKVEFQNGSLSLEDVPNGLSQLQGTLEFNQNRLEVKSLTAMTGGGQLSLGGYLAYQHGIYADLSVTGKQIRIRYPEGVSSLADANLQLQGSQSNLLLSGNILITRFSVSPDLDVAALAAQANAVQTVAPPSAPSNHLRLDVRIQSSPQLNFQNAYAKLAGDVDLRLRGTVASPSLLGRISISEGNAIIAGTRYELQRGDVMFTNPVRIQPTIDLNATARVEDYDITLGLHGTTDKMSITYRSDPPLPEADVVALLALGRTQSAQGLYTQQQQQSAGLSPSTDVLLGGALNATVSSRVQKLFGAGSVKLDPSYLGALGNSTTRITVEEQFGKNVTLTYATNVDTSAQQLLQAEFAVNRHVSIQMTRDESGVFSMVIKAIRRYR